MHASFNNKKLKPNTRNEFAQENQKISERNYFKLIYYGSWGYYGDLFYQTTHDKTHDKMHFFLWPFLLLDSDQMHAKADYLTTSIQ